MEIEGRRESRSTPAESFIQFYRCFNCASVGMNELFCEVDQWKLVEWVSILFNRVKDA